MLRPILIILFFVFIAVLMITRKIQTMLALPVLAVGIALLSGAPLIGVVDEKDVGIFTTVINAGLTSQATMNKIKVAIYCRVSPFADEFTLAHLCGIQKATLMEKAAASNFEIAECYEDIGYTGDDSQRPALQRLLRDYASGKFSMVLVAGNQQFLR